LHENLSGLCPRRRQFAAPEVFLAVEDECTHAADGGENPA
jgi:hypothetical protein